MAVSAAQSIELSVAERDRGRITKRLMPFLLWLYFLAYIDRTSVSVAALQMKKPLGEGGLGFTDDIIGSGAGIFFLGYFLLEIPGTLIVERWSARKWIARIMVTWGVLASITGLVQSAQQLYWARFFLGLAEAGFFPGMIVYLTHWFRAEDRAKAVAMFMTAIPISQLIGAPISGMLMRNVHWLGYSGWRWLLILEGAIRVQRWGDAPQDVAQGDAVVIPPGEKHWHGAVPGGRGVHLALNINVTTKWLEPVDEDDYRGRPSHV